MVGGMRPVRTDRPSNPLAAARARRVAGAFAAGGLLPFATWFLVLPALGAADFYRGASLLRPFAILVIACAAGGWMAGRGLGPGRRWPAAFGAAFGAVLWIPLALANGLPALTGGDPFGQLLAIFVPIVAVSHALLGGIGFALGGRGWRGAGRGALAFGAAGVVGGAALAAGVRLTAGEGAAVAVSALGGAAACLLPLVLAGWWCGRAQTIPPPARARTRCGR